MKITEHFRRPLPHGQAYANRYAREMRLIEQHKFEDVFIQVRTILDLAPEYRYVTRGSAGCSLIGYLLGIHNMDPIEHNFALSRFMHEARTDLPDIDLDFAYNQRNELIERIHKKYPNQVARISNHVTHRTASAIRQALREAGINKFLPKNYNLKEVVGDHAEEILERAAELTGSFKHYSLHCGGIVIFPDQVPQHLKLNDHQIKLNKDEIEEQRLFKIDLLCNRALAQLNDLSTTPLENYPPTDTATANIFQTGNTWGIAFGESPAQRKLHLELQPKNRDDITLSLALIRPLPAANGRKATILKQLKEKGHHQNHMIYDDDGIYFIQNLLNCSESEAETYRNAFSKQNYEKIAQLIDLTTHHPNQTEIITNLNNFKLYSFCKAHATNYGQLVWALAYEKAHQPHKFWLSALNHSQSMYRPWVHIQEAKAAGLKIAAFGRGPWRLEGNQLHPTHPEEQGKGLSQYNRRGYWISNQFMPGCYHHTNGTTTKFRGLIAAGRHHHSDHTKITFLTIGYDTNKYLDLIIDGYQHYTTYDLIEGEGKQDNHTIKVTKCKFHKIPKTHTTPQQTT